LEGAGKMLIANAFDAMLAAALDAAFIELAE
jgi:hypothetical protein